MPYVALALVVTALIGGGVSALADRALPGEPLYPFKIGINERAQHLLARTDVAAAQHDMDAIATRFDEALTLAPQGRLDATGQTLLVDNIVAHDADIAHSVVALEEKQSYKDAATISSAYRELLVREKSTLEATSGHSTVGEQVSLAPILTRARVLATSASLLSNVTTKVDAAKNSQ